MESQRAQTRPADADDVLGGIPPLSALSRRDLSDLLDRARLRSFERDEFVGKPGDAPDHAHLVLRGVVWVGTLTPTGQRIPFRLCGPGSLLGIVEVLDEGPRTHPARALTAGTTALLPASALRGLAGRSPPFAMALARLASGIARDSRYLLAESRSLDVGARLVRRLFALAEVYGRPALGPWGRGRLIDLPLRHQDLADIVGASRETVSKAMSRLASSGALRSDDGRIILIDEPALKRVARLRSSRGDAQELA